MWWTPHNRSSSPTIVIATPAPTRKGDAVSLPGMIRIARTKGNGSEVRWRKSQPPSLVVVSGCGVVTNWGQFDRVRGVDKIRTSSVGYRHEFNRRLIGPESGPRFLCPRHDREDPAGPPAPVRARVP